MRPTEGCIVRVNLQGSGSEWRGNPPDRMDVDPYLPQRTQSPDGADSCEGQEVDINTDMILFGLETLVYGRDNFYIMIKGQRQIFKGFLLMPRFDERIKKFSLK